MSRSFRALLYSLPYPGLRYAAAWAVMSRSFGADVACVNLKIKIKIKIRIKIKTNPDLNLDLDLDLNLVWRETLWLGRDALASLQKAFALQVQV